MNIEVDPFLQSYIFISYSSENSYPITIFVNGLIITGIIIKPSEFHKISFFTEESNIEDPTSVDDVGYLNLKDITIVGTSNNSTAYFNNLAARFDLNHITGFIINRITNR